MPHIIVSAKYEHIEIKRFKHQYVCDCCEDEFANPVDKAIIRKTHLCMYCYEHKLMGKRCNCNDRIVVKIS